MFTITMGLRYLLVGILVCVSQLSFSQEENAIDHQANRWGGHNLSVGYGFRTPDYILDGYHPGRPTEFDYNNKGSFDAVSLTYQFQLKPKVYFGFTAIFEQQEGDWLYNEIPMGNVFNLQTSVKGAFVRTCFSVAPEFQYNYFVDEYYKFYTAIGFGVTYRFETDQYTPEFYNQGYNNGINIYGAMRTDKKLFHFTGYYAPIGLMIGKDEFRFFIEAGFGYKGVINTGIAYKFKEKKAHK